MTRWGRRAVTVAWSAGVLTLLVACGDRILPPNAPNVAHVCDTLCTRLSECRPGWDVESCNTNCRRDTLLPYFRDDYVEAITRCVQTATCDVVLGPVYRTCWQATRPEPTDLARRTCLKAESKDRVCTGEPVDVSGCLIKNRWGVLKESVLQELSECEEMPCGKNRRFQCVRVSLGQSD